MSALRRTTITALVIGAALLAPTGPATAAGETCRGEAATLVGATGEVIRGTADRDVVVTNNSQTVDALGGDDLICVTGRAMGRTTVRGLSVTAGDGDDVVDATLAPRGWPVELALGPGADEFVGSSARDNDVVTTGPAGEADRDVVNGGGGRDTLISRGGPDEVYGDAGVDVIDAPAAMVPGGVLDGGRARDAVVLDIAGGRWQVDLATGATRNDVRTHTWTSIEALTATGMTGYLQVSGTSGPDRIDVVPRRGVLPLMDVRTGRGADQLSLTGGLEDTSGLDLGAGRDDVRLDRDGHLSLYLRTGTLVMGGVADVRGVEDATAYARSVVLIGTDGPNRLRAGQCDTVIRGRGGADDISWGTSNALGIACDIGAATEIRGGAGGDRIVGSWDPDLIDAGPGRDTVDGSRGRDTCVSAERQTSCEGRG